MTQQKNGTRNLLIGFIVCGVLLIGIVAMLNLRGTVLNRPTATPPPTATAIPGVIEVVPPRELLDFTLPASTGEDVSLSDLQGKHTLLFFGYTHCPDFCPMTLAVWKRMKETLGSAGEQVNYVFVSVDGERDTPEVLTRYLERFDETFIGLTGNPEVLAEIAPDYGLDYVLNKEEGENYSVAHTTRTFLIDPQGRLIGVYSFDVPQSVIVESIQAAMAT